MATIAPTALAKVASNNAYLRPPHIRAIETKLLALSGRAIKYLLVEVPPRHGKSELISKYFPAWYLGMFPTHRVILTSYEAGFARSWGRRSRDLLAAYGHLFGVSVREDVFAQDEWELDAGGGMITAGVGGAVTGRGGNLIITDDPHKNAEDALSATMRAKVWDWWQSTLFTRLEPDGVCIIIQTRWHQDDLIGKALSESGLPWDRLKLPAIAGTDDPLGRLPGQSLWPERYNEQSLATIKDTIGSFWWSALYQQEPVPMGDTLYRRTWAGQWELKHGILMLTRYGETIPTLVPLAGCVKFGVMDVAASTKQTADYTVLSSWLMTPQRDLILLDVDRRRLEGPDQVAMMQEARAKWGLAFIGVEATAYQLTLLQHALRQGIPVKPIRADRDKIARALTGSAYMEAGKLYFPKWAAWLPDFEAELYAFPSGKHDDQADTVAYAAIYAGNRHDQGSFDE
jgi:predicted phage terminase large subunit-like protein